MELGGRRMSVHQFKAWGRTNEKPLPGEPLSEELTLREALSAFVARQSDVLPVATADGVPYGTLHFSDLLTTEIARERYS